MEQATADRRIRRTKALLRQALTTLLREKRVQNITVTELTRLADVNRGTFYSHYSDVHHMADCLEEDLFSEFSDLLNAYTTEDLRCGLRPILEDIFSFVDRNADMCTVLFRSMGEGSFFQRMKDLVYTKVLREWGQLYGLSELSAGDYYLCFLVAGIVGMVQSWVPKPNREPPSQMATLAEQLIVSGMTHLQT